MPEPKPEDEKIDLSDLARQFRLLSDAVHGSQSKLQTLLHSRRFWVAVASVAAVAAHDFGLPIDEQSLVLGVTTAAAWILGDSLRVTQ